MVAEAAARVSVVHRLLGDSVSCSLVIFDGGSRYDDVVSVHVTHEGARRRVERLIEENEREVGGRWSWMREFTAPNTWHDRWRTSMGDGPTIRIEQGQIEV